MKFRSKPVVVDLVAFHPRQAADLEQQYPRLHLTRARDGSWSVWNEKHRCSIMFNEGDFLNVTVPGDYYALTPDDIAVKYDPIGPEP